MSTENKAYTIDPDTACLAAFLSQGWARLKTHGRVLAAETREG